MSGWTWQQWCETWRADLDRRDGEDVLLEDLEGDGQCRAAGEDDEVAAGMAVHGAVAVPFGIRRGLADEVDVAAPDGAGQGAGAGRVEVEHGLLLREAPRRALAVVYAEDARELVHVPYLEQAACTRNQPRHGTELSGMLQIASALHLSAENRNAAMGDRAHLTPSRAGSVNRQSLVGLPGRRARSTEPSGKTIFLSSSKSCLPGASLQIHHQEHHSAANSTEHRNGAR